MNVQVIEPHIHSTEATGRRYAVLYHQRRLTNAVVLALGDGVALGLALLLAGLTRQWLYGAPMYPNWSFLLFLAWGLGTAAARLLPGWGLGAVESLRRLFLLLGLLGLGTASLLFATKTSETYSRLTVALMFFYAVPLLPYFRSLIKKLLIQTGRWGLPTAIYGGGEAARKVIESLRAEIGLGFIPTAVFDDDPERWGDTLAGVPVLGSMAQSTDVAPVAIVAMPDLERGRLLDLLEGPLAHYKQTVIIPDLFDMPSLWVRTRDIAGVLGLEITSNLLDPLARFIKRSMDLLLVVGTMPLWLPLCLLIAVLIRLIDGHAAVFRQERVGKAGRRFKTLKFQSMVPNAEAVLQRALAENPALRAEWEQDFKLRKDPRVTSLGTFLRRTSMDELPQLINVLRGEMSLVGPRPLPAYHLENLSPRLQQLRARLRPGLTGLWQVSGRSDVGNEGIERWDAYYVRNWSIWLDLVILTRTVRALIKAEGAY